MRTKSENIELLLNRVTYKYISGNELVDKVKDFYNNYLNCKYNYS